MPGPQFIAKALFFTDFCFVASPSQNSVPKIQTIPKRALLDDGQTTYLICVHLKYLLYDFFVVGGGPGFPILFPFSFPVCSNCIYVLDISCAISTGQVQNHQKTTCDSENAWAPSGIISGKSKWGLNNGGLRYLSTIVHDCLHLSSSRDEKSLYRRP